MSQFTTPLETEFLDGKFWRLVEAFEYHVGSEGSDEIIRVPVGFLTDFASIPKFGWSLIGHPAGEYGKAAVIHDWLYSENAGEQGDDFKPRTRKRSDQLFLEGMVVLGVAWWKRTLMYSAVRCCGWRAWGENRKGLNKEG
jgi:hypothetical protein